MMLRDQFTRTVCDCARCVTCCKHMPGMLVPGDLELLITRLAPDITTDEDVDSVLEAFFVASRGTKLADRRTGTVVELPTIVPRSNEDGSCVFLTNDRCRVHDVAPFGCAYLDVHMPRMESDPIVLAACHAIMRDFWSAARAAPKGGCVPGFYAVAWSRLMDLHCEATPLRERKRRLREALDASKE